MVRAFIACVLIVVCWAGPIAAKADVDVRIDRTTVPITDSIRIVFIVDGDAGQPDFSPLDRDFEVLATSQSTSVRIVNGQTEQSATWTVDLMPRRVGELTVPPIDFGGQRSPSRTISVTPASSAGSTPDGEVFLEIEAEPVNPYVQAQTYLTVRVFRAVAMSSASLTEPNISEGDAVIERVGNDVAYETSRGGARFSVVERRYVIFPQRSGRIVIDPVVFEGRVGRARSLFDTRSGRVVRVRSDEMELNVLPIPDSFPGQVWLPAERVQLVEDWPGRGGEWRAGEPLTRTLTLQARGLIASQLPEINMQVPDGLKQYPDQPKLDTRSVDNSQIATRRETIALIPTRAGQFTLPAIEIPWWNTQTDQLEYARLPEQTFRVLPAADAVADVPAAPALPEPAPSVTADTPETRGGEMQQAGPAGINVWQWVSAALATLWFVTLASWWWSRREAEPVKPARLKPVFDAAQLKRACNDNDSAVAAESLLHWAAVRWPGNAARSLGELAARLDGPLQRELHRLSRARYSASGESWDGAALWQAFESDKQRRSKKTRPSAPGLEPLYRA